MNACYTDRGGESLPPQKPQGGLNPQCWEGHDSDRWWITGISPARVGSCWCQDLVGRDKTANWVFAGNCVESHSKVVACLRYLERGGLGRGRRNVSARDRVGRKWKKGVRQGWVAWGLVSPTGRKQLILYWCSGGSGNNPEILLWRGYSIDIQTKTD